MAQDSIAYGESLLADIRERNAKETRRREKEAKKDAWKALGMKVAIGVSESLAEKRQQQFLNNEENMKNKLLFNDAVTLAEETRGIETAANNHAGGYDNYFQSLATTHVDDYLATQYAPGTYNQSEYDLYKAQLNKKYGDVLKEKHKNKLAKVDDFLATTGGDKDAFINALKAENPGTLKGLLRNVIGQNTGLLRDDLASSTSSMLESAEAVKNFEHAYAKTGDISVANFIADNKELQVDDLGVQAPTYSDIEFIDSPLGGKEAVTVQTVYNDAGNVESINMIRVNPDGGFSFDTEQSSIVRNNFNILAAQVKTASNQTYFEAGKSALMGMDTDQLTTIQDLHKERIKKSHKTTSGTFEDMMESVNDDIAAKAGAIIYTLQSQDQLVSASDAAKIAQEMLVLDAKNPGSRMLDGVGTGNPYHTLFAMESLVKKNKLNTSDSMVELATGDLGALYNAYRTETKMGRDAIDAALAANDFFGTQLKSDKVDHNMFERFHTVIKHAVDNGIAGTESNLGQIYKEMFSKNPLDSTPSAPTVADKTPADEAVVADRSLASLGEAPTMPSRVMSRKAEGKIQKAQYNAYQDLKDINEKITETQEKLDFYNAERPAGVTLDMIDRMKKSIMKNQIKYNKLYDAYMKQYAPATPSLLAAQ